MWCRRLQEETRDTHSYHWDTFNYALSKALRWAEVHCHIRLKMWCAFKCHNCSRQFGQSSQSGAWKLLPCECFANQPRREVQGRKMNVNRECCTWKYENSSKASIEHHLSLFLCQIYFCKYRKIQSRLSQLTLGETQDTAWTVDTCLFAPTSSLPKK